MSDYPTNDSAAKTLPPLCIKPTIDADKYDANVPHTNFREIVPTIGSHSTNPSYKYCHRSEIGKHA